jgi:ribosomal protein L32
MVCRGCGKESADEYSFCPYCGKQKIAKVICSACGKESVAEFSYCPHCGQAFAHAPSAIESPGPSPELQPVTDIPIDESPTITDGVGGTAVRAGTLVFAAFAAISLLVSIIKGLVPIYLFETAGWAGAAWYWQAKKTHTELAKAIVIVLAVLVGIGEVIHIVWQTGTPSTSTVSKSTDPFEKYAVPSGSSGSSTTPYYGYVPAPNPDQTAASNGSASATDVAEIEQQAVALYKQKHYSDARSLFDQACNGGEMRACNYLGYLCARGLGGAPDLQRAHEVYEKACDQGAFSSCASLGSLYQNAGDTGSARKYFQKACDGGLATGCDLLQGLQ